MEKWISNIIKIITFEIRIFINTFLAFKNIYHKHSINASDGIIKETTNINSGRAIRDDPLRVNINILENFDDLNDNTICTPRNTDQIENFETLPTNSNLINDNESQDSRIISVHSSDTSYILSDTPLFFDKSIPDNKIFGTIDSEIE